MNYMKNLLVLFLVCVLASVVVNATSIGDIIGLEVEVNDVPLDSNSPKNLEKTDELDVLVVFGMSEGQEDVQITAELTGYDKSDKDKIEDETGTFDVRAGQIYDKRLNLELPVRFDQGEYSLKIRIDTKEDSYTELYPVYIDTKANLVEIRDIVLSPENEVKAGRALLTTVRVKNRGERQEEDIKVKASIPALGISASDYIDELDSEDCEDEAEDPEDCDDSTSSEELYMRIPDCAEAGEYTVRVVVEYDDGDEEVVETTKIRVVESDTCYVPASTNEPTSTGKTVITIGPETQDVSRGATVMYPVTIANQGSESKTYSINVDAADWAEFAITPSNVMVIGAGESKVAYIALKANSDAAAGSQIFSVTVKSGDSTLKQVPLKANVQGKTSAIGLGGIKRVLEVGLVILVVLLVILGLIIGFNKLKGSDEEGQDEEKTYY